MSLTQRKGDTLQAAGVRMLNETPLLDIKPYVPRFNSVPEAIESVLAYFNAAGVGAEPNDVDHPITTRQALKEYNPGLFALADEMMTYKGKVDWRYDR